MFKPNYYSRQYIFPRQAYGAVTTWTADTVLTLGGTVSALSATDLSNLPTHAVDFDAMTRLGLYGNWSAPEKVSGLFVCFFPICFACSSFFNLSENHVNFKL